MAFSTIVGLISRVCIFVCVSMCRRWLPRTKLDPLGVDAELDRVKLAANNKPNVCTAIQRAYDRAIQQFGPTAQGGAAQGGGLTDK